MAPWTLGQLVSVQARTWAGINQPGGIARIVKLNDDDSVAVKYVVDGRQETSVDISYLRIHTFANTRGLRNRGLLLGRCERCGSLRTDCGSCDWQGSSLQPPSYSQTQELANDNVGDSDDSSSVDLDRLVTEHKRAFQRFKKRQAKSRSFVSRTGHSSRKKKTNDGVLADATSTFDDEQTSNSDDDSATEFLVGMVATQDVGDSDASSIVEGIAMELSRTQDTTMEDDSSFRDHVMLHQDDDYDTNDAFVQPEGSAERLPTDVTDRTKTIAKADLPEFVTTCLLRIEKAMDQTYHPKMQELEQNGAGNEEWDQWHATTIKDLIRNGLDQCRLAMRRMRVPATLEFRYDSVSNAVEELMARIRRNSRHHHEEFESDETSVASVEGWAENTASPISYSTSTRENNWVMPEQVLLDAHPFASRRKQATRDGERRSRRQTHAAKRPSSGKSSQPTLQRLRSPNSANPQQESDHSNESVSFVCDGAPVLDHRQSFSRLPRDIGGGVNEAHSYASEDEGPKNRRRVRPRKQRRKKSHSPPILVPMSRTQDQEMATTRMERWIARNTENLGENADQELPVRLRDEFFQDFDTFSTQCCRPSQLPRTTASRPLSVSRKRVAWGPAPHPMGDTLMVNTQCTSLQSVLMALENEGCRTLQDYVSSKSSSLHVFLSLLRTALHLMKEPFDIEDSDDSTRLSKIFKDDGGSVFLEAVALQATDTTMSLFNPRAWDLEIMNSKQLLGQLGQLWTGLALHAHPVELFARCVMRLQHSQKWRLVREGDHVFVSCVNPDDWKSMILTGDRMRAPDHSRIAEFKKVLPRCEVDSLWGSIAMLSQNKTITHWDESQPNQYKWDLVSVLFSRSSLVSDEHHLPPAADQLHSALKDLRSFLILLQNESFGDLPKRDKLLVSVVEQSVSLEADYLEQESASCWPKENKVIRVDAFGDVCQPQTRTSWDYSLKEKICDLNGEDIPRFLGEPLLLPSSPLVRVCLGLIACWRSHLRSDKPKRVQFFLKAMRMLIQAMVAFNGKNVNDKENRSIPGDSFLDAFGLQAQSTTNAALSGLHCSEARAFVSVFSFLPMRLRNNDDGEFVLPDEILDIFSNEQLLDATSIHIDDSIKLEITAKVASFLLVALLENRETVARDSRMSLSTFLFRPLRGDNECYDAVVSKLVGCLSSCIKRASEPGIGAAAMARVVARVTFALSCLWRRCQDMQQTLFVSSTTGIEQLTLYSTIQLIRKIVQLPTAGHEEETCVRITYSLMRVMASLIGSSGSDISDHTSQLENTVAAEAGDLVNLLSTCIHQSSPSKRFNVSSYAEEETAISAAGMDLISRTMKDTLACIMDIVISTKLAIPPKLVSWMSVSGPSNSSSLESDNDQQYKRRVSCHFAQVLTRSIRRSSIPIFSIGDHKEALFSCFIQSLLDIKMLRKIPSLRIQQIGSKRGGAIEQMAFSELLDFSKHSNGSLRRYLLGVRTYANDLSYSLKQCDEMDFCSILEAFGQLNPSDDLPHSLELEMIDRFRFMCGLLHQAYSTSTFLDPDRLSCQLLGSMCWNLIFLWEKLEILDRTLADIGGDNYRRSKLFEIFRALLETFMGIFASICRVCGNHAVPNESALSKVLFHICNSTILPICQGKSISVKSCLRETAEQCSTTTRRESNPLESSVPNNLTPLFQQIVRESFIRRSKEIFAGLSGSAMLMRSNLFASYVAATNASSVEKICSGLCAIDRSDLSEGGSHLQRSIDKICREVRHLYPLSQSRINDFRNLRQTVLETHILPMLNSKNPQTYLEFLIGVLDSCLDSPCLKSICLCAILRAITTVAVTAVREGSNLLLCTVVKCFLAVARLPAVCLRARATGWLLDWAQDGSDREAEYFWLVFQFHDAFYKRLQSMQANETLSQSGPLWSPTLVEGHLDRTIVEKLQKLDRELLGEHTQINNVYRKQVPRERECMAVSFCRSDEFIGLSQKLTEKLERAQSCHSNDGVSQIALTIRVD